MKKYPFNFAYTYLYDLYGLEIEEIDFENIGLIAWNRIGNMDYRLYKYIVEPTEDDDGSYYVDLPCNCDIIEAVTTDYEDYQKTSPIKSSTDIDSSYHEAYVESHKFNTNHLYMSGKYIKYIRDENRIYLADRFSTVKILYKGVIADDEGLPKITKKEADAIATFVAYSDTYKRALHTQNQFTYSMSQDLKAQWLKKCNQARVPDYINQNELDEILNVSSSWDRKRFGKSYKPIR